MGHVRATKVEAMPRVDRLEDPNSARVRVSPKLVSGGERIDAGLFPPCEFVARAVNFAMMHAAERDNELVADLTPECTLLREPKMMRVRRLAPADQAWALGYPLDVNFIAKPPRLRQGQRAFVNPRGERCG